MALIIFHKVVFSFKIISIAIIAWIIGGLLGALCGGWAPVCAALLASVLSLVFAWTCLRVAALRCNHGSDKALFHGAVFSVYIIISFLPACLSGRRGTLCSNFTLKEKEVIKVSAVFLIPENSQFLPPPLPFQHLKIPPIKKTCCSCILLVDFLLTPRCVSGKL